MSDYSTFSEKKLKTLIEEGDTDAAYTLANRYIQDGEQQEAFDYMLIAARGGVIEAMDCMGMYYAYGLGGVEQDMEKAEYWFMKGKNAGSESDYLEKLQDGTFFSTEEEEDEEDEENEEDDDNPSDIDIDSMEADAEEGDLEAIRYLSNYYGFFSENKDNEKALKYIEMGYALKDGECAYFLAEAYRWGHYGMEKDLDIAKECYKNSSLWGYSLCYYDMADLLYSEGEYNEAFEYSKLGVENGNIGCLVILGNLYFWGKWVKRDVRKARQCFEEAISWGDISQRRMKGLCEELLGEYLEAEKSYKKAMEKGDKKAPAFLARMYNDRVYFCDKKRLVKDIIQQAIDNNCAEAIVFHIIHMRNPSPSECMPLIEKGIKMGNENCIALKGLYGDPKERDRYYEMADNSGSSLSAYFLGKQAEAENNMGDAQYYMERAAINLNYPIKDAMFRMGKYLLSSSVIDDAKCWFEMARDFGHSDAEKYLEQNFR